MVWTESRQQPELTPYVWLVFHVILFSPYDTLSTQGVASGGACPPLLAVEQIALSALPAGSQAGLNTKLPLSARHTETLATIPKATVLG